METEFMAHLGEKTITLSEDEVAMLTELWDEIMNHNSQIREYIGTKEGRSAMNLLARCADPYAE